MAVSADDIRQLYRTLLGREADAQGLSHYLDLAERLKLESPFPLAKLIVQSDEFRRLHDLPRKNAPILSGRTEIRAHVAASCDPQWIEDTFAFYRDVEASGLAVADMERVYKEKGVALSEYFTLHAQRFRELFGWLKSAIAQRPPGVRILEIGTSAHTTSLYKPLLGAELNTVCRPPNVSDGPTTEWALKMGSARHWMLDLNQIEASERGIGQIPAGSYDFIVCCEVVEHLLIDPSALLRRFLPKLKPGGRLFLSTPNYFRPYYVEKTLEGFNPAHDFKKYAENFHAHHHFREYTPRELVACVEEAGGEVWQVAFSKCWNAQAIDTAEEIPLRDNMIILATVQNITR